MLLSVVAFVGLLFATPVLAQQSTCLATTAAPTYTNNTLSKLSCDLSGNLRTSAGGGGGGTSSNFGTAFPTAGTAAGASDGVDMQPLLVDGSGNLKVNVVTGGGSGGTSSTYGAAFPSVGTAIGFSDGTNMQYGGVDASHNVKVNLQTALPAGANVIGAVTQSGAWSVGQSGTWNVGLSAGSNIIGKVSIDQTTPGTTNGVQVNAALPAGTNIIGKTGIDQTTPGTTNGVVVEAATVGGATSFHLIAAATNNSTLISTGAHTLYDVELTNNSATIAYAKFYDKSSAPTCGTDTPIITLIIPASTAGAGSNVNMPVGRAFASGLGLCVVTGIADNDNTAVAATTYAINVAYK